MIYSARKRTKRAQDHDLWFRFYSKGFEGNNLDEVLYYVRDDRNAVRRRTVKGRLESFKTTVYGYRLLGFPMLWLVKPAFLTVIFSSLTALCPQNTTGSSSPPLTGN